MSQLAPTLTDAGGNPAAPDPGDPLDKLLELIIGGYFVLTDGQGSVSKWSHAADLIFGRGTDEILGQRVFDTLITGPLSPEAEAWRRFLEQGVAAGVPARVEANARHARGGEAFGLELYFVPVKLDEGFDFSLFLEDLSFELPMDMMLMRMRQQHPVVIRALNHALAQEVQPWENWRVAGTLVVFRPLAPTPWVDTELRDRDEEREAQAREMEEARAVSDPGVQGQSLVELDDAAAVVARMLDALDRLTQLEEAHTALPSALEDARSRADAAQAEVERLRVRVEDLQTVPAPSPEAESERAELLERVSRLEAARADAEQRVEELRTSEHARAELAGRVEALEAARSQAAASDELARAMAEAEARRGELEQRVSTIEAERAALQSELHALESGRAGDLEVTRQELTGALERLAATQQDVERMRSALDEAAAGRAEAQKLRSDLSALREEDAHRLRAVEQIRRETEELREHLAHVARERDETREASERVAEQVAELRRRVVEQSVEPSESKVELSQVTAIVDSAVGDVESLRAQSSELHHRLDALAAEAAGALRRAEEAGEHAASARADVTAARAEARDEAQVLGERVHESLTEARAAHAAVEARRQEAEEILATVARLETDLGTVAGGVEAAREEAGQAREEAGGAREAVSGLQERVEGLGGDADRLREDLTGAIDRLEALPGAIEESAAVTAARAEASAAADSVAAAHAEIAELRSQADALRAAAAEAGAAAAAAAGQADHGDQRLEAMGQEMARVLAQLEEYRHGFDEARQAAVVARREAEQARRAAEEAHEAQAKQDPARDTLREIMRELSGHGGHGRSPAPPGQPRAEAPAAPAKATEPAPARDPIPGFDDTDHPLARLDLQGRFRAINPAFQRLVGYGEQGFSKAMWPSVHDRQVYEQQQQQLAQLAAGELGSISLSSTYLHGQGLMVLVVGELELVRNPEGQPDHLLLRAEHRQAG